MCCSLGSTFKIQTCDYLIKQYTFIPQKKNSHGRILKGKSKKQHLSTVPKSCS